MVSGHVDGHRPHVGPHHAGDEEHGQKGEDDRQGGQDHRRAHLVDGGEDRLAGRLLLHLEVAVDVLHVDDGVVDQQAQGEDQGEEGHPVDGVAEPVVDNQGERIDDRNRDGDDQCLTPPQGEEDQPEDGGHGDEQLLDQLVDLVVGGLAVVAGHPHLHVVGDDRPLHAVDGFDHLVGHRDGVGPLLLGDGDVDRLVLGARRGGLFVPCGAEAEPRVGLRLRRAVADRGNVVQVDGGAVVDPHHQSGPPPLPR